MSFPRVESPGRKRPHTHLLSDHTSTEGGSPFHRGNQGSARPGEAQGRTPQGAALSPREDQEGASGNISGGPLVPTQRCPYDMGNVRPCSKWGNRGLREVSDLLSSHRKGRMGD